jgi:hypothetical protein
MSRRAFANFNSEGTFGSIVRGPRLDDDDDDDATRRDATVIARWFSESALGSRRKRARATTTRGRPPGRARTF